MKKLEQNKAMTSLSEFWASFLLLLKFVQIFTDVHHYQQVHAILTICSSSSYVKITLFDGSSNTSSLKHNRVQSYF